MVVSIIGSLHSVKLQRIMKKQISYKNEGKNAIATFFIKLVNSPAYMTM